MTDEARISRMIQSAIEAERSRLADLIRKVTNYDGSGLDKLADEIERGIYDYGDGR